MSTTDRTEALNLLKARNLHHLLFGEKMCWERDVEPAAKLLARYPVRSFYPGSVPRWDDIGARFSGVIGVEGSGVQFEVTLRPVDERGLLTSHCTCTVGEARIWSCVHGVALAIPALRRVMSHLMPSTEGLTLEEQGLCIGFEHDLDLLVAALVKVTR